MTTPKTLAEQALNPARIRELWTANYFPALPFTPQQFDIGTLLPAMLYMARWGQRRGKGTFKETFGAADGGRASAPRILDVALGLKRKQGHALEGFGDDVADALLGDLLLTYVLENRKRDEGRDKQVQRIFATHYLASWVDLPDSVSHLRGVPELLTAVLAQQRHGEALVPGERSRFPVGDAFASNPLLLLFARHMRVEGLASNQASDRFNEQHACDLGIDEWLSIRIAKACGRAPDKTGKGRSEGDSRIPNRWPIAQAATRHLRQDVATFIQVYGEAIPRQAFLPMLESGFALGLSNVLLETTRCLFAWDGTGKVSTDANPWPLFVDASLGQDRDLRNVSEAVMSECAARYERVPVMMMSLRILEERARFDRKLRDEMPSAHPDGVNRLNFLGELLHERHPRADHILDDLDGDCLRLADQLKEAGEAEEVVDLLRNGAGNPARRLAEGLISLIGDKQQGAHFRTALENSLMTDRPNGIATKRRVTRTESGRKRSHDVRSIVLTNPVLDFLVHRHLRKDAKGLPAQALSFQRFLRVLRESYGLYVDREPPGASIPQELLRNNTRWLERRLRDLGLLIGVNDAESMKQLRSRFQAPAQIKLRAGDDAHVPAE